MLGSQAVAPSTPTAFEEALDAIANMPKLNALQLTNPPEYRKAYHRPGQLVRWHLRDFQKGLSRCAFRPRPEGLIWYLGDRGSKLKRLAFAPVESLDKIDHADKHGHIWPHYFYKVVRVTDTGGNIIHLARPLAVNL